MQADGTKRRTSQVPNTQVGGRPTPLGDEARRAQDALGRVGRFVGRRGSRLLRWARGSGRGRGTRLAPQPSPEPEVFVANGKAARQAAPCARRIRNVRFRYGILSLCVLLQLAAAADEPHAVAEVPQPLPSLETVVRGLADRLEASETQRALFYERYRHVTTRIREERNTKGKLRERSEERTVHNPQTPPSADAENGPEPGHGRAYRERDVSIDGAVLQRYEFEVEGREDLEGRQVLRASFRPRDGELPKHNMLDRVINKMAGTLWLEEPSMALVRARLRLIEPVDFWGGIAGAIYRLEMSYDCACTPDGLWYTRRGAWEVDYRKFLKRSVVESEELCEEVEPVTSR